MYVAQGYFSIVMANSSCINLISVPFSANAWQSYAAAHVCQTLLEQTCIFNILKSLKLSF